MDRSDALKSKLLDERSLFKAFEKDNDEIEDEDDDEDDDYEGLNIVGHMELDTLVWPTIIGTINVEETDDTYFAFGNIRTLHGVINFTDIFYYPVRLNFGV